MTDLAALLQVAEAAADLARTMFLQSQPGRATAKGERDFATELDLSIERAVRAFLHAEVPHIGFLGEEEGRSGSDDRRATYWALDPVDGTANLMHGLPICGTSLGLIVDDQPVLGVVDFPHLGERYSAHSGRGATLNGRPIRASDTSELAGAIVSVGDFAVGIDADHRNEPRHAIIRGLSAHAERVRMLGSAALDLTWVAAGRLDGSVMLSNKTWDVAAGVIIAREAGALVLDLDGTTHSTRSRATISAAPGLAHVLVDLLASTAEYASR